MREGGGGGGGGGDDESLRGRESGEGAEGSRRATLVLRQATREEKTKEGEREREGEGEREVASNIHVKKEREAMSTASRISGARQSFRRLSLPRT